MSNKPYTLLVGVDFSELANRALQEAFSLASQRPEAEVHVLTTVSAAAEDPGFATSINVGSDNTQLLDTTLHQLRVYLQTQLDQFRAAHPEAKATFRVVSHALADAAVHGIVQLASDLGADLIVVGTHNRKGVERLLLGSVAEGTVRHARCPVLVIPAPSEPEATIQIEPPCPECVKTRAASAGKQFWCAQHGERHGRRHTYHQSDRSTGDSNFPLVFR